MIWINYIIFETVENDVSGYIYIYIYIYLSEYFIGDNV